jgi:hypothetical protein
MKQLIIGITVVLAFQVGNVEAAQWMPLDEAEDRLRIRTNNSPEEGGVLCTSHPGKAGKGIGKDGRRLGFLTKKGCKTIGGGDKVRWFKRENGDIMVLVDDEPAVQDDAQNEGEDYQARYEEARDAAAKAVQQLQDAQEREANLQEQHDAALVGMVAEADVTPLNCSEGTAVNAAGDACEPTAEYRAAAVEEGRLAGVASATPCPVTWHMDDGIMPSSIQHPGGHDENGYCLGKYLRVVSDVSEIKGFDLSTGEVYDIICRPADVAAACGKIGSRPGYGCKE